MAAGWELDRYRSGSWSYCWLSVGSLPAFLTLPARFMRQRPGHIAFVVGAGSGRRGAWLEIKGSDLLAENADPGIYVVSEPHHKLGGPAYSLGKILN
jgi:hypothetical protein